MNDQLFADTKRAVLAAIEPWIVLLGLEQWTIQYEFTRGSIGDPDVASGWTGLARTHANWPYLTARIEFGLEGFADLEAGDIEHQCLHELVHVLLDELQPDMDNPELWRRNEHATELATRALLRTRYRGSIA